VVGVIRRRWFQIFISGLVLQYLVERARIATSDLIHIISVIVVGAFLVPLTFVTYLYDAVSCHRDARCDHSQPCVPSFINAHKATDAAIPSLQDLHQEILSG
jgi:energy-coupling factor transporter transmembrane protein EcfT